MNPSCRREPIRIGLLGSGTVGEAVQTFVFDGLLEARMEARVEIVKIYTPHPKGKKWYAKHPSLFTTKADEVIGHPDVDIVVEVLGARQEDDLPVFKDYLIRAMQQGKSIVTSDKAVLARFGAELWKTAGRTGQAIGFEGCVGGGIPIIRSLQQSLAAEEPQAVYGIVNGTCNYIMTAMSAGGRCYDEVLREAQRLGYAETNPNADISGKDSEAKLILLVAVAFGLQLKPEQILRKGIETVHPLDFQYAGSKGSGTIKYLAVAREEGVLQAYVAPVLVPEEHFLAGINGVTNAICFNGKRSRERGDHKQDWNYGFIGPGAGGVPTAIALLGDVCSLSHGVTRASGRPAPVYHGRVQPTDQICGDFYVRFVVKDQNGIVGDICRIFGAKGIHVAEVWQLRHTKEELQGLAGSCRVTAGAGNILPFVITLERTTVGQLRKALGIIRQRDFIVLEPMWIPIWRNP